MLNPITRSRSRIGLLVALLAIGIVIASALTAHAEENPYGYNDACPGYQKLDGRTLRIRSEAGDPLGRVMIGIKYSNGTACVATFKNDKIAGKESYMAAYIWNGRRTRQDLGEYAWYAGDACTDSPSKCSVLHARNRKIDYGGMIVHTSNSSASAINVTLPF